MTHTKNLAATDIAREAFGKYYDDALRMWMREHVGRPVTTWQVLCDLSANGRNSFVWILVAGWLVDSAGSPASFGCKTFNQ